MNTYNWGADGIKRTTRTASGLAYSYVGSLTYLKPSNELTKLESIDFGEGRFINGTSGMAVNYHITDHWGSIRCPANASGAVIAGTQIDYYPLGERYSTTMNQTTYRYQYRGKERQSAGGISISLLDFGARMYNSQIGWWSTMDPLVEKYYSTSPYAYCANNPINVIDPDGKKIVPSEVFRYSNSGHFKGSRRDLDGIREVGDFEVSPYYKGDDLIGWSAYRNGRIQYMMDRPSDIDNFTKNAGTYAIADDLFYMNGTPSEGQVAMAAGDLGKGLAKEWGDALTNPSYYMYLANALGGAAIMSGNATTNVYRVYGGDAKAAGRSWTPSNPNSVANYRSSAGLPSGGTSGFINTGRFVIEGTVKNKNITQVRPAQSLDGHPGGLPEYLIDPNKVNHTRISGANPQF